MIVTNSADTPLKGLNFLLEAVAEIRKKQPVKLTVIGQPKKDGIIENLVAKLGVSDIVHFTGRIDNEEFADYYAKSTIAVVPSLYEGFGIPAAEAMACGVPLISTSGGALPEVVGDAGMIVPPADAKALANAITHLLNVSRREKEIRASGACARQFGFQLEESRRRKWSKSIARQSMVTVDLHELKLKPRFSRSGCRMRQRQAFACAGQIAGFENRRHRQKCQSDVADALDWSERHAGCSF